MEDVKPAEKPAAPAPTTQPTPASAEPKPPVMDVKPRQSEPPTDKPVAPPPEEPSEGHPADQSKHDAKAKPPKPPKPPRQPGVGLAVVATVLIVLGLGLLATYAYLRSNNITLF